ncbi:hypothetical protein [Parapedobacter lycopersici]|uniref:hypothetical protein n=1 Tax=Parapedobacter lycopersici TaxID=1864939 RepID=UPI00214DE0EB|nr:hypothetical protein [Parapedobacter lycopersici]
MKTRISNHLFLLFLLTLGLTLSSCSKDKDEPIPDEVAGQIPGLGEAEGEPQGAPFTLPDGVRLESDILGESCDTTLSRGSGYYVTVCVGLVNETNEDITLVLPAGLVLIAQDKDYQSGMLLQGTTIVLRKKAVTRCTLFTFCANNHRSSSSRNCVYTLGPVTNSRLVGELIGLLQGKRINAEDYGDDETGYMTTVSTVQSALWSITDGYGLDEYYKMALTEIPNK